MGMTWHIAKIGCGTMADDKEWTLEDWARNYLVADRIPEDIGNTLLAIALSDPESDPIQMCRKKHRKSDYFFQGACIGYWLCQVFRRWPDNPQNAQTAYVVAMREWDRQFEDEDFTPSAL